jgi:O-antigen/teichoic acid export membrane protein
MGRLIKNTALYAFGNILPQLFGFILLPLYTRFLSPAEFGLIFNMQTLQTILLIFFTLSLENSIYRLYYDYKSIEEKRNYLGTIILSILIVSSVMLLLLFLLHNPVSHIYKNTSFFPYYAISILTSYLTVFSLIPKIYYQVNEKASKYIKLSISQFFTTTILVIWFVIFRKEGAIGMLKGMLFGNMILVPVFLIISYKIINFRWSKKILLPALSYSLPIIPYVLSNWIMNMSNRIFIDRYFTQADNGIYGMGYKIASISLILTTAIALAYNPYFFKIANSDDQNKAKRELYLNNNIIVIVLFLIGFLIAVFAKDLVFLFLNKKYLATYEIIPLLVGANMFTQMIAISNLSFAQAKKTKQLMYIVIVTAGLNILLNFLFIPNYGVYGAAYASIISQGVYFMIAHIYARRYYYIPFNWLSIIVAMVILSSFFAISFWLIPVSVTNFIIKILVIGTILSVLYLKYSSKFREIIDNNFKPEKIELKPDITQE